MWDKQIFAELTYNRNNTFDKLSSDTGQSVSHAAENTWLKINLSTRQ